MTDSTKFRLIYDPNQDVEGSLDRILRLLEHARQFGIEVELVDTNKISEDERMKLYFDSIVGSVMQKAAIRKIFGSNTTPGLSFGRYTPTLHVIKDGYCVDVYPQKRSIVDGQRKSIEFHTPRRYLEYAKLSDNREEFSAY